ncbi:MAG TPA: electron transfer flavoprotein subunit alpha/FixB family protein [Actinospica sp.]|nr:electron transfer flavoprotein subunit alpha/FixB family protein [Actinospica sp.]
MAPVDPVLVLADHQAADQSMTQATRELLTAARRLGTPVTMVTRAHDPEPMQLAALVRELRPLAVLICADRAGDELAARLAVCLESGIVTDVVGVSRDRDTLFVIQEAAGGTCRIATELRGPTPIITVRRGVFPPDEDPESEDELVHVFEPATTPTAANAVPGFEPDAAVPSARGSRVLSRRRRRDTAREAPLDEADVVVAGGRGVGSAEGFSLLARLALVLGARLGGTHTAGELGWCPEHARISLPGAQIRPSLYLAGGVSGSLRHRAAIRRARTVVAIDRDPAAPIFREADFGIVGDLHEVLPALLDELARRPRRRHGHDTRQDPQEQHEQQEQQEQQLEPSELAEA